MVSRLTSQKGLDLVLEALPGLLEQGGRLAGAGTRYCRKVFWLRPPRHRAKLACRLVITRAFSPHYGGADVILVPSRFEACGNQLYGLKYGALCASRWCRGVPVVWRIRDRQFAGKMADGVASSFVFETMALSLLRAIRRAFVLWSRPSLCGVTFSVGAVNMNFSWQVAAHSYRELLSTLL